MPQSFLDLPTANVGSKMYFSRRLILVYLLCSPAVAQVPLLQPQNNTFNSSFTLTDEQISRANLSAAVAHNVNIATRFERSNWATGPVLSDPFYTDLPLEAADAPPGSLLKVEEFTDTSTYTLAPTLALSRFIYQSRTLNGTAVPVSAYILWPFYPRGGGTRAPIVSWGHGTSGGFAECAPSHVRSLWYQFSGPYALALAGYAVVATDYAGLGVSRYPDGRKIQHQYEASPAAGYDILYAVQAAREAFPDKLTEEFAVMGVSQGGGAAWGAAQVQREIQIPGYRGSIAAAPVTDPIRAAKLSGSSLGLIQSAKGIQSVFPDQLLLSDILTERGIAVSDLAEEISACNAGLVTLATNILAEDPTITLTNDAFLNSSHAEAWADMVSVGGKDFQGPLLLLQGTADGIIPETLVTTVVNETCERFPHRGLHYVRAESISHVPILYAAQQLWLDWLSERFRGSPSGDETGHCSSQHMGRTAPRPLEQYTSDIGYFMQYALEAYSLA